ncbi:hypothetical protein WA026_016864, partial [Henosepilachna vigintioctopunctata]
MTIKKLNFGKAAKNGIGKNSIFDPDLPASEKKDEPPPIGYLRMFRYTTGFDKLLIFVGFLAIIVMSAIQPLNNLLFGDLTQSIIEYVKMRAMSNDTVITDHASEKLLDGVRDYVFKMCAIGSLTIILGYISIEAFSYT